MLAGSCVLWLSSRPHHHHNVYFFLLKPAWHDMAWEMDMGALTGFCRDIFSGLYKQHCEVRIQCRRLLFVY